MEDEKPIQFRKHLQWGEQDPMRRRNTPLGMWAWMFQRVSALLIILLLVFHITLPYKQIIQLLLLLAVTFHAALGIRVILLDFNIVNVRHQKLLAWGLLAAGLLVVVLVWICKH